MKKEVIKQFNYDLAKKSLIKKLMEKFLKKVFLMT